MFRLYKKYFKGHYAEIFIVFVAQCAQTAFNLMLPNYNASIINDGILKGDTDYIWAEGGWMLLLSGLQVATNIAVVYFGTKLAIRLGKMLRHDMFEHIMDLSMREISVLGPSSLTTRLTNDVLQVQNVTYFLFIMMISAPLSLIGGVFMAMRENIELSSTLLIAVPLLIIVAVIFVKQVDPLFRIMQKRIDKINEVVREQIAGTRVIRAFVREDSEKERFDKANTDIYDVSIKVGRRMSLIFPLVFVLINCTTLFIMYFGAGLIDTGNMQIGSLTAFLVYIMYIFMSLMMSSMMFIMLPRAMTSAKRAWEVLDTKQSVLEAENAVAVKNPKGVIEFKDVTFKYPNAENPVLKNLNFTLTPGETTAIIGSTGSGKSTVARLIPRLFDVTEGKIEFDGVDIRDLKIADLNDVMGIVPQKAFLFSGTVRSNMLMSKADATDDEIWEALEIAQAADFVRESDGGLDAFVASGGANFSGGQKQRLAIARAVLRRPKYFQFDDSFSALDYVTDKKLRNALQPLTKDASVLIVAQRVSSIRDAKQIIVLDDGVIRGIGTHSELLKDCDTYREIVDSQMTLEEAGAENE
ncbi:MAG: ABC transporter ATP-binding protein/permease [Bifidobacteriaceae bacterium]|jgi:ATP-binding cassette subfamily B protein|nr:ABC transporter ATP-binding protein/permease [Bifidobacteriaceae bacterium]